MKIKTRLGIFLAKSSKKTLQLLKRNGTSFPGMLALKVDNDILTHIDKPKHIMAVTGTNGKTTTSNIISDTLDKMGVDHINNSSGANIKRGITGLFIDNLTLSGKVKSDNLVMEIDELWLEEVFQSVEPSSLTLINLFQDSYERNANIYYTLRRINRGISQHMSLIINGDDPIVSLLGRNRSAVYFGIDLQEYEEESYSSYINDMIYCPICSTELDWDFKRYNHIGRVSCPSCDFQSPKIDYRITKVDKDKNTFILEEKEKVYQIPIIQANIENLYNQLAAYTTLRENGYKAEDIIDAMSKTEITKDRFSYEIAGSKRIHNIVAKGYNPISNSRAVDTIYREKLNSTVIYLNDGLDDTNVGMYGEVSSWLYDVEFEKLEFKSNKIIIKSWRSQEIKYRLLLAGISKEKIFIVDDLDEIPDKINWIEEENIFLVHDIGSLNIAQSYQLQEMIVNREKEVNNGN